MAFKRVWVWGAGRVLGADAQKHLERAQSIGFTDICIVVNNAYLNRAWHCFKTPSRIADVVAMYLRAGITPHLMTWIVPESAWVSGMVRDLVPAATGAASVMIDAEEPWVEGSVSKCATVAGLVKNEFKPALDKTVRVTAIVCHDKSRLRPLIEAADGVVPQAYSLLRVKEAEAINKEIKEAKAAGKPVPPHKYNVFYNPGSCQKLAVGAYTVYKKPIVLGLAAYQQAGAGGMPEYKAVRWAAKVAEALKMEEVAYWALHTIGGETERAIREICAEARKGVVDQHG